MNFYFTYLLAFGHERYEDHYWQHCDLSDRFWMGIWNTVKGRA